MNREERAQNRLKAAFGGAPAAYRRAMETTLECMEGKKPMKRWTMRTAAAMLALMVVLTGIAVAAGTMGVFDFLSRMGTLPEDFQTLVQTEFAQQGGDMEDVTVTVRDAVSDGVAVFMAVEFKAKNPQDVVLIDFDADPDGAHEDWMGEAPGLTEADSAKRLIVIGRTDARLPGMEQWEDIVSGVDWAYEGMDTLIVNYVIDLRRLPEVGDRLNIVLTPIAIDISDHPLWKTTEEAEVRVSVKVGSMESVARHALLPADIHGYHLKAVHLLFTPLATYAEVTYQGDPYPGYAEIGDSDAWDMEAFEAWMNRDSNMWFGLVDEAGDVYPRLTGGRKYGDDSEDDTMPVMTEKGIYAAAAMVPETIVLYAYDAVTGTAYDRVTLNLEAD